MEQRWIDTAQLYKDFQLWLEQHPFYRSLEDDRAIEHVLLILTQETGPPDPAERTLTSRLREVMEK